MSTTDCKHALRSSKVVASWFAALCLGCGLGATPTPTPVSSNVDELGHPTPPDPQPSPDDVAREVLATLGTSRDGIPASCAPAVFGGESTIGEWMSSWEDRYGPPAHQCRPCEGVAPSVFNGSPVRHCADVPESVGVCDLVWDTDSGTRRVSRWWVDKEGRLLPAYCHYSDFEMQEALDDDDDELPTATDDGVAEVEGKSPVAGVRYWARPGDLDEFLFKRRRDRPTKTVKVSTIEQLIRALASDTLILLEPGRYEFRDSDALNNRSDDEDWSSWSPHYKNGVITGVSNLVIAAATDQPTLVLQPDAYAPVLHFDNVNDVGLFGLTIGHRPDVGWCMGDVLRMVHASRMAVGNSTLFGSGTKGFTAVDVDGFRLTDSVITDSSEAFGDVSRSRRVVLKDVVVAGNTRELLRGFTIHGSDVLMESVVIKDNHRLVNSANENMAYGRLMSVGAFDPGAEFGRGTPYRVEARSRTKLTLRNVTADGELLTWPPSR